MATNVSAVSGALGRDNVTAQVILKGESFPIGMRFRQGDAPRSLERWRIAARATYFTATIQESGSGDGYSVTVSNLEPADPAIPSRDLDTQITDAAGGEAMIRVPADLYAPAIPLDVNEQVPVVIVVVTIETADNPADILKFRHLIIIRGLPT